jgi:hypothetical protein
MREETAAAFVTLGIGDEQLDVEGGKARDAILYCGSVAYARPTVLRLNRRPPALTSLRWQQ